MRKQKRMRMGKGRRKGEGRNKEEEKMGKTLTIHNGNKSHKVPGNNPSKSFQNPE